MKNIQRILVCGLSSALAFGLASCGKTESEKTPEAAESVAKETPTATVSEFVTLEQKVSYGVGRNIGGEIARDAGFDADVEALVAGLRDSLSGAESRISEEELQAAFVDIRKVAQEKAARKAAENSAKAAAFLATNAKREGVVTTASGLQYEVLTAGTGAKPTTANKVKVHYHGTLIDGTVFDSSVERGEPIEFAVTGVIKGWTEALQLMSVGSKWKLFIPANLAYGDRATGSIPPGSTLIFEVELLEIK